ncbi:MAG: hypothetical protein HYS18_07340 [Burkholderiales bacterium]|nr:hypothetical protein [Burkholderiales bacterium]
MERKDSEKEGNKEVKKSLMYFSGEDFYYFTYSIILLLDLLDCENGKFFKDYRKLPFLIDLVNDENLIYILESSLSETASNEPEGETASDAAVLRLPISRKLNKLDKEYMFRSYSTGIARRSEILKLLFTLEQKEFVVLQKGGSQSDIDVSLIKEKVPSEFFNKKLFAKEYKNIQKLRSLVKRISSLTLNTMLTKLYTNQGVKTWAL